VADSCDDLNIELRAILKVWILLTSCVTALEARPCSAYLFTECRCGTRMNMRTGISQQTGRHTVDQSGR
jgi:hypothetical protein